MSPFFLVPFVTLSRQGAAASDLVISGARIVVGNGTVIPSGTILVHDGKIAAVGASLEGPMGSATVVNGAGLTVYPGFINAYTSDGLKLPEAPSNGTAPDSRNTAPATMFHENRKGVRADIVAAKCLNVKGELAANFAQGVTTALVSSGTGSIRGNAAVIDYTATGNVLVANAGTELSFRGGGGGGGGGGGSYPGTLFGTIANLRQWLADAQFNAAQPPAKPDASMDNLKALVSGQAPALFAVDTSRDISRAVRIADEFNLKMEVVGGKDAYRNLDLVKKKRFPVIVNVDPGIEPTTKVETTPGASPQGVVDERHKTWVERNQNVKKLKDAGVPLAFCCGTASLGDYLKNVRLLIKGGLPEDDALKALTSGAAQIMGIGDKVGTIETGKLANLVILTGDFADEKSTVKAVVVEGSMTDLTKGAKK